MNSSDFHGQAQILADTTTPHHLARKVIAADLHMKTLVMPIIEWLAKGETGISSETMAFAVLGVGRGGVFGMDHPYDPGDFKRCVELLEAVPAIRDRMSAVAALSPVWARLVAKWDTLEWMLKEEIEEGTGRAPKTYQMMKQLIEGEQK